MSWCELFIIFFHPFTAFMICCDSLFLLLLISVTCISLTQFSLRFSKSCGSFWKTSLTLCDHKSSFYLFCFSNKTSKFCTVWYPLTASAFFHCIQFSNCLIKGTNIMSVLPFTSRIFFVLLFYLHDLYNIPNFYLLYLMSIFCYTE